MIKNRNLLAAMLITATYVLIVGAEDSLNESYNQSISSLSSNVSNEYILNETSSLNVNEGNATIENNQSINQSVLNETPGTNTGFDFDNNSKNNVHNNTDESALGNLSIKEFNDETSSDFGSDYLSFNESSSASFNESAGSIVDIGNLNNNISNASSIITESNATIKNIKDNANNNDNVNKRQEVKSVSLKKNKKNTLDFLDGNVNAVIELNLSEDIDSIISVLEHKENPKKHFVKDKISLRFIDIEADNALINAMQPSILKIAYTDEELMENGIKEESLRMYYFNENLQEWESIDSFADTSNNFVVANINHFSSYSVFGDGIGGNKPIAKGFGVYLEIVS